MINGASMNYKQRMAIEAQYRKKWLALNPALTNNSGIYVLTREDEDGFKFAYIGQARHILDRLSEHFLGYQHIDLSLKSHKLYSDINPYGWKVDFIECSVEELDSKEQYYILEYANKGYQLRNKTTGSQGKGKKKLDEYRPTKTYRDGLEQGRKNASKEIAHLFDLHLNVVSKNEPPNKNQQKALEKFEAFLDYYKEGN